MTSWHHGPLHQTVGAYMITGSIHHKQHFFSSSNALDLLQSTLMELISRYQLEMLAWALFPNHYHLIILTYPYSRSLQSFITQFHSKSSRKLNLLENIPGRKIWFQYWDTRLTYQASYYAWLNYVMQNPVHHKIVSKAEDYPWYSTKWFMQLLLLK